MPRQALRAQKYFKPLRVSKTLAFETWHCIADD